jgi:hypothetical protein
MVDQSEDVFSSRQRRSKCAASDGFGEPADDRRTVPDGRVTL